MVWVRVDYRLQSSRKDGNDWTRGSMRVISLSLNTFVTDELLVTRLPDLFGNVVLIDYKL